MQEFFKVFFINLISDIDNMLILGTILRKHSYLNITLPAVMVLTLTRTIYIIVIDGLSNIPVFHLLIGFILLFIAFKLARSAIKEDTFSRNPNRSAYLKVKVLLLLAATDFLICLDSVVVISEITQHVVPRSVGIFCSLFISLLFFPLIVKLATTYSWIHIIAGGFIAQKAVIGIVNDPCIAGWVQNVNKMFPGANIVYLAANGTVIMFVVIGLYSYIKNQRITLHK